MNRRVACVITAALGIAVASLAAQQKPNFSGRWVAVSPPEAAGQQHVVKHEGATLTESHGAESSDHAAVYNLDGKESRNVLKSHGEDIVTLSQTTWNGQTLTITSLTTYPPDGRKVTSKQNWSLDAEGRLVIEFNETADNRPLRAVKMIFVKK